MLPPQGSVYLHQNKKRRKPRGKKVTLKLWWGEQVMTLRYKDEHTSCSTKTECGGNRTRHGTRRGGRPERTKRESGLKVRLLFISNRIEKDETLRWGRDKVTLKKKNPYPKKSARPFIPLLRFNRSRRSPLFLPLGYFYFLHALPAAHDVAHFWRLLNCCLLLLFAFYFRRSLSLFFPPVIAKVKDARWRQCTGSY